MKATPGAARRLAVWMSKSMEKLAATLTQMGHPISADTVCTEPSFLSSKSCTLTRWRQECFMRAGYDSSAQDTPLALEKI
jgi:hypothetical protein